MSIIGITGNPATGKKTIGKMVSNRSGFNLIEINQFIIDNNLHKIENNEYVIENIKEIQKKIKKEIHGEKYIIIGHLLSEIFNEEILEKIFVLRCSPEILLKRYNERKYNEIKIRDNIVSEMIGTIYYNTLKKYGHNKTFEINVSDRNIEEVVNEMILIINNKSNIQTHVDWLDVVSKSIKLRKYLS